MSKARWIAWFLSPTFLLLLLPACGAAQSFGGGELIEAVKGGRLEKVRAMVAKDPQSVDLPDEAGYTPLRWAGIRGHGELAVFLLKAGADPNSVGSDGGTPLHGAAHHDDPAMMSALVAAGGDVTVKNQWGRTPLHVASRRGCAEMARVLLSAGADPDATTNEGWSTLAVAYRGGHPEMVDLLLTAGADPGLKDSDGQLPGAVSLTRPEPTRLSRRRLDEYVGHYDLGGGFGFEVWRVGDGMHLMEFAPDSMIPVAVDTFFTVQEPWRVVFTRNDAGRVVGMDVDFLRRTVSAEKKLGPPDGIHYVGSMACLSCHEGGPAGGPAGHWVASRHSRAVHTLSTDQAKALAAGRDEYSDITDPSRDRRCLMCHLTAAQLPEAQWPEGVPPVTEGVGCEACHGPGSEYMSPEVMADRGAFLAAGGQVPHELTCRRCHRDAGFAFSDGLARIRHWR